MTTTATRPAAGRLARDPGHPAGRPTSWAATAPLGGPTRAPALRSAAGHGRALRATRSARTALVALLGSLTLTVPALTLLGRADTATVDVVTSFLIVGALELVTARALWSLTHRRSPPAAYAALLARIGYALLVAVGALVLLDDGARGAAEFRQHWTSAAAVIGLGFVALAVAFWHSRIGTRIAPLALAGTGLAGMAVAVLPVDVPPVASVLPLVVGDLVLVAALAGRTVRPRPTAA
ncbi:hypothetical protein [Phycicoccus sp.]|uniref:hypothetical protein n=1 Tax=Phycicoccus sp. TaxID=1902410 RepID=UPI002CADB995|nr:hypothetical protein [Phycicoccus sp.]HMM96368.1 hypothetical protein [Phycicoccus sp.]